ncbi:hypothetical protein [Falsiruegeria mediterranea]|uniref:hypothetical protein n=1 Tax=Falsiruegeria mediterranea TaxID=1280832 RepID=UPI0015F254B3|nr:hypothetical protein [Falsiruegeria mediterranea]
MNPSSNSCNTALARSNLSYEPQDESAENLRFIEIIDKQFLRNAIVRITSNGTVHAAANQQDEPNALLA